MPSPPRRGETPPDSELPTVREASAQPERREPTTMRHPDGPGPSLPGLPTIVSAGGVARQRGAGERRVGPYAISEALGRGGMGEVLRGRDPDLGRDVAIKRMHDPEPGEARRRFLREARITGQLEHPGIVPIYAVGQDEGGQPYFTMKEVKGHELLEVIERQRAPLPRLLGIFVKVCEALAFAHARGVIHRDLKPANVMVGAFGEVLVLDWGLAREIGGEAGAAAADPLRLDGDGQLTLDGAIAGTPAYMPPEQAEGRLSELDARADVYALGAILYHALVGHPPYRQKTALATLDAVLSGPPPPPSEVEPGVPWELEAIVEQAMARDPEDRYPDARALADDVSAYLEGRAVGAASYSPWAAARKWLARNRRIAAAAAAALLTAGAFLGWSAFQARQAAAAQTAAIADRWREIQQGQPEQIVARAAALTADLDPQPTRRPILAPTALAELGKVRDRLQAASQALSELLDADPDHAAARALHRELLTALGRVAEATHDDALAQLAYQQAAGRADAAERERYRELARVAGGASAARQAVNRRRILATLDQVDSGTSEAALAESLALLVGLRERQTSELLVARLERASEILATSLRAAMLEAQQPNPAERGRGETEIAGLPAAVDRWLEALPEPPELSDAQIEAVNLALRRLLRRTLRGGVVVKLDGRQLLAARQRKALEQGGVPMPQLKLIHDALGLLDDPSVSRQALRRYVSLELDRGRSQRAALALVRLARSERDVAAVYALAKLPLRAGGEGPAVKHAIERLRGRWSGETADSPPEHDGAIDTEVQLLIDSGQLERARERVEELLRTRPELTAWLLSARAIIARRSGDLERALADWRAAVARSPRALQLWLNIAATELELGRLEDGERTARKAWAVHPNADSALLLQRALMARDKLDEALELSELLAERFADRAEVWVQRAELLRRLRRPADARRAIERAFAIDPEHLDGMAIRGKLLADAGRSTEAIETLEGAARGASGRSRTQTLGWLADALRRDGQLDRALEVLDKAIAERPSAAHLLQRAQLRMLLGQRQQSLADARQAAQLAPNSGLYQAELARALVAADHNHMLEARRLIDAAAQRFAGDPIVQIVRSKLASQAGDLKGAAEALAAASELSPQPTALLFDARAQLCLASGDPEGALRAAELGLALEPGAVQLTLHKVLALRALGRLSDALSSCQAVVVSAPAYPPILLLRASLLARLGRHVPAIADLDRVLELQPDSIQARLQRAASFRRVGDLRKAHADLADAIDLDPKHVDAWCQLADLRLAGSQYDLARRAANSALEAAPGRPRALILRGLAYGYLKRYAEAEADFRAALKQDPKRWVWRSHLAATLRRRGQLAAALAETRRALRDCPDERPRSLLQGQIEAIERELKAAKSD